MSKQMFFYYYLIFWLLTLSIYCDLEKIKYISLERPMLQHYNKNYVPYFNLTARRYSRGDPNYYFTSYGSSLLPLDNNITANFYFYEFSNNIYKKTFLELHFKLCDLLNQDKFIGSFLSRGTLIKCPLPPGTYYVANSTLSIDHLPSIITLIKGRVQADLTYLSTGEVLMSAYADVDIKERLIKQKKG